MSGRSDATGSVDPSVFSDVIDSAFTLPGADVRRMMRVRMFSRSVVNEACGGESLGDINGTGSRYDQAVIPDLELIKERGLSEADPSGDKMVELAGPCAKQVLPNYFDWLKLSSTWSEVAMSALNTDDVIAEKKPAAECLEQRSGLRVDASDPMTSYISEVDAVLAKSVHFVNDMKVFSVTYAQCTSTYFKTLGALMKKERPILVERNRELLERYSIELVEAGYVP